MSKIFLVLVALASTGCAYSIHQYGATDFTGLKQGKRVTAEGSESYILFKTNNSFVEQAYSKLIGQCADGYITGITTQYRTDLSFLSFTERLVIEGTCVTANR
ncbi:MAG: hypothetical protein RL189_2974 [Pseudomonadota bacterium]